MGYDLPEYARWMLSWNASTETIRARMIFARHVAERWPDPRQVTGDDLAGLLAVQVSGWTRSTYYTHLRSLFGWLLERGRVDRDPTLDVRRPRTPRGRPHPLPPGDVDRVLGAVSDHVRPMLLLGLLAGLRAHETARMHSDQITVDRIRVTGKGGRVDELPTHPILWELASSREGYWFPGPGGGHIGPQTVTWHASRLFRGLGISGSYHRCRHTYGTSLLRAGNNLRVVQELMRHSSLATTEKYLEVNADERRAAVLSLAA
jgi:integrase/recombinase XerD